METHCKTKVQSSQAQEAGHRENYTISLSAVRRASLIESRNFTKQQKIQVFSWHVQQTTKVPHLQSVKYERVFEPRDRPTGTPYQ